MNFSSRNNSWFKLFVCEDQSIGIDEHHQSILVGQNKLFKDMHWDADSSLKQF